IPKKIVANDFFADLLSGKELRLFEKTVGILERRWAEKGITASDLGFEAATQLFNDYPEAKDDIECLIFLSQTPDYKIPFTSNILQHRLGLKRNMLCLDINAGCAGFVQGLGTAFTMAKTMSKGKVLFIVAETMSKILSNKDRGTTMLFGDGAVALLVENTGNDEAKAHFNYFTDGGNSDAIIIPDGGYRNETTISSFETSEDDKQNVKNKLNLSMDGARVFDFTLREITPGIEELFSKSGVDKSQIDKFLLHQSNQFIIKQIASQLGVASDKMPLNISRFGNTSGVSIPLLMATNHAEIANSENLLLSGYGVGLNWANCILQNNRYKTSQTIEI
ncbi:MAG TPA: ketoacyl-ACP synthase III, partial [Flavobacterium sp.]|nr:ketoacyl-ACP synthase III [Flavobacterium sp.]